MARTGLLVTGRVAGAGTAPLHAATGANETPGQPTRPVRWRVARQWTLRSAPADHATLAKPNPFRTRRPDFCGPHGGFWRCADTPQNFARLRVGLFNLIYCPFEPAPLGLGDSIRP